MNYLSGLDNFVGLGLKGLNSVLRVLVSHNLKNSLQNLKFSDVTLECQINGSPNSSKGLKNWKISQSLVIGTVLSNGGGAMN